MKYDIFDMFDMEEFVRRRDEAAQSFDVKKFKEFMKWGVDNGFYDERMIKLVRDDVLEITMRKMVIHCKNASDENVGKAVKWLLARGYDLDMFGGDE